MYLQRDLWLVQGPISLEPLTFLSWVSILKIPSSNLRQLFFFNYLKFVVMKMALIPLLALGHGVVDTL